MAWLIKRGKTWVVRWYALDGTMLQRSTQTRDKRVADEILREAERQIALGKFGIEASPAVLTLTEAWRLFVDERKTSWDAKTRKLYDWAGARLLRAQGNVRLTDVTSSGLERQVATWRETGELSDTSTAIWMRHVRSFLNHTAERGRCARLRIKVPPVRKRAERVRVLKTDELERLFRNCHDDEARTLFQVMLLTGARLGHVCNLLWDDVNLHDQLLYLRAAHGKGGKPHEIELFATLRMVLEKHGQNRSRTGKLWRFGSWRARKLFERARDAAGLSKEITPHCLRHTAAAGWLARGVPIYDVSKLLNHSSVAVTQKHYGHLQRGSQRRFLTQSDVVDFIDKRDSSELSSS